MGSAMKLRTIAAMVLCFTAVAAQNLTTFTATYTGPIFNTSCYEIFQFENAATFLINNSIQLTRDNNSASGQPLVNESGRVTLKKPFRLWEQGYDRVASFNSSFLFSIDAFFGLSHGEGLAFIIAPNTSIPSNSFGQYLGLTNNNTDGSLQNQLVAIEFDNVKQDFDPGDNHVGLNINSVKSNVTASLNPLRINLTSTDVPWYYNVWVEYNGVLKVIEVYIAQAEIVSVNDATGLTSEIISIKPDSPVLISNLDLQDVLNQYSYFGFSGSTGSGTQLHTILSWNLTVESYQGDVNFGEVTPALAPTPEDKHYSQEKTPIIVGVGVPLLAMMATVTGYCYLRKKRSVAQVNSEVLRGTLKRLPGSPREFLFEDLKNATNNFDKKLKLGQGGFGIVYLGHLHDGD